MAQQEKVVQAIAGATVKALAAVDAKLDSEIDRLDNLDAKDMAELRKKRLLDLQNKNKQILEWKAKGHGVYQEIQDQKDWFAECKNNDRVVCHFFRPTTWRCEIVDKHLTLLAAKHLETRFIKINAEKAPFLCERLSIVVMPTIYMAKDSHTLDLIEGFEELGKTDEFTTQTLEKRIAKKGAIDLEFTAADVNASEKAAALGKALPKTQSVKANKSGAAIYSGGGKAPVKSSLKKAGQADISDSELTDED